MSDQDKKPQESDDRPNTMLYGALVINNRWCLGTVTRSLPGPASGSGYSMSAAAFYVAAGMATAWSHG